MPKAKDWIVIEDKDGKLRAIESPHNGLQEKLLKQGIKVYGSVLTGTAKEAIDYVGEFV